MMDEPIAPEVLTAQQSGFVGAFIEILRLFTDDQRVEAFDMIKDAYCPHCGTANVPVGRWCRCWDDS